MMYHRPSSSSSPGGPHLGPTTPCNEVMCCASMSDNVLPFLHPISTCYSVDTTPLQPFNIFNSTATTAFNFQGEIDMAATLGFPFTAAQWKELERQAMIYKYMVASVPVPYELLLPIIQNLPVSNPPLVRYSTKQDLEPGRCKRTDGKKWRCSRDVAPNQKYCERHMHRGRPRSRKHVELSQNSTNPSSSSSTTSLIDNANNKKTRLPNPSQSSIQSTPCKVLGSTILPSASEAPLFLDNMHTKIINNRGLDWSMGGGSEQQWRQIMQTSHSVFNNNFGEEQPLNLLSFTDFGTSHDYLGSETPRRDYIDAWSTDKTSVVKDSSVCSSGNLSSSALNLSMAMALGNTIDNEFGQIHRGLGVSNMASPGSCGTAPGGPLAEVLRPSMVAISSDLTSPYPTGRGDSVSPPATTVSSPSGVLQRTMLSLSDGSVCNSPTLAASSAATPTQDIVGFQWFT